MQHDPEQLDNVIWPTVGRILTLLAPGPKGRAMTGLEALGEDMCSHARRLFADGSGFEQFWLIETCDGERSVVVTPLLEDNRDGVAAVIRRILAERKAQRYAMASEVWIDRRAGKDAVMVIGEDRDGSRSCFIYPIDRTGAPPRLAEREAVKPAGGRFTGLFADHA